MGRCTRPRADLGGLRDPHAARGARCNGHEPFGVPTGRELLGVHPIETDQEGEGNHRPLSNTATSVLRQWLERAAIADGAVWRTIPPAWRGESFVNRIAGRDVARIFKRRCLQAALSADTISGHSTRVGAAQDLIEANFSTPAIMLAGGWTTERMVAKYGRKLAAGRNAMAQLQRKRSPH